jgi:hypothetical protein
VTDLTVPDADLLTRAVQTFLNTNADTAYLERPAR